MPVSGDAERALPHAAMQLMKIVEQMPMFRIACPPAPFAATTMTVRASPDAVTVG